MRNGGRKPNELMKSGSFGGKTPGFRPARNAAKSTPIAEIGADAMQHRNTQRVIVLELVIGFAQPDQDRRIETVLCLWSIDRD